MGCDEADCGHCEPGLSCLVPGVRRRFFTANGVGGNARMTEVQLLAAN